MPFPPRIGGQAVIEGVMMRSPGWVAVVTRSPAGKLVAHTWSFPSLLFAFQALRLPLLRGIVVLYESLVIGSRALLISAGQASTSTRPLTAGQVRGAMARSLAASVALFFVLPAAVVRLAGGGRLPATLDDLIEGALRIGLVLAFLALIGRIPEIRRVFQYHGAEHKAVNAFEMRIPLEIPSVRMCSRFHPRCGTSFLLVVLLVAVIVFAFLGHPPLVIQLLERVLVLPLVAGLSYELIRLGSRSRLVWPILLPGMWLQRLTTEEPDDRQIEVAIEALQEVVARERGVVAEPKSALLEHPDRFHMQADLSDRLKREVHVLKLPAHGREFQRAE
jgi:uncharacterized protein YqhQ